jgi:hypothetical protein
MAGQRRGARKFSARPKPAQQPRPQVRTQEEAKLHCA